MLNTTTRTIRSLAILACCFIGSTAMAQGTSGRFSDPMTYDGMRRLLAPLQLSEAQYEVANGAHARYLETLLVLRHGAMTAYLERFGSTPLAFGSDRDVIVSAGRERKAIETRMIAAEHAFFAEIRPVLTEAQQVQVSRMADRRERARLGHGSHLPMMSWSIPRLSRLDLVRYIDQLDLEPAVRQSIDQSLAAYETTLTPLYRTIHGRRHALPLAYFDRTFETRRALEERLEQLQTEHDLESGDGLEAYSKALGETLEKRPTRARSDVPELEDIRKQIVRISRLNRQLLDEIRPLIGVEAAEELERRYVRRAIGSVGVPRDPLRRRVDRFVESDADPAVIKAVEDLYDGFLPKRRDRIWRLITAAEESEFRRRGRKKAGDEETDVQKARGSVRTLDRETLEAYAALTGETIEEHASGHAQMLEVLTHEGGDFAIDVHGGALDASVSVALPAANEVAEVVTVELSGAVDGELDFATVVLEAPAMVDGGDHQIVFQSGGWFRPSSGGWLPGAITSDDVEQLSSWLEIGESMRPVLDALYDDYQTGFRELEEQVLAPAREQLGEAVEAKNVDESYAGIRTAMDSIVALDTSFFEDVWAIRGDDGDEAIARAKRARLRDAYASVGRSGFMMGGASSREHTTDLLDVARGAVEKLDEDMEPVTTHDLTSVPLVTQRWYAKLDEAIEHAKKQAEQPDEWHRTVIDPSNSSDSPSASIETQIADLNRSTLRSLSGDMEPVDFHAVRQAYQRKAFPSVYRDRDGVRDVLDRAQALTLDAAARRRLDELCLSHHAEYEMICDRMIDTIRAFDGEKGSSGSGPMNPARFERRQKLQQELGADRFERKNLNQRTRQTLIELLDAESRAKLGLVESD